MSDSFPAGIPGLMSQFNPLMSAQANPAALHLSQFQHLQRLQANQRILGNIFCELKFFINQKDFKKINLKIQFIINIDLSQITDETQEHNSIENRILGLLNFVVKKF